MYLGSKHPSCRNLIYFRLLLLLVLATCLDAFLPRIVSSYRPSYSCGGRRLIQREVVKMGAALSGGLDKDFIEGKVVWITGASSGLGRSLALQCARHGARVVLSARSEGKLREVQKECLAVSPLAASGGERALVRVLDMGGETDGLTKAAAEVAQAMGQIDILINNAGVSTRSGAEQTSADVDVQVMQVNFFGPVALTKAALPFLRKSGRGHIIVINSVQGKVGLPARTSYSASKHALTGYFDSLRAELAPANIGVTAIFPGYIKTSLSLNALTGQGGKYGKMDETTAKGMDPDDLALRILKSAAKGKHEMVFAPVDARAAIFLRNLLPDLLFWILAKKARKALQQENKAD